MMGSPYHQNAGDCGIDMGYWEIYKDAKPKFVKLDLPEYKYYNKVDGIPNGDHIYMPVLKTKPDLSVILNNNFANTNSKKQIAKSYLKQKGIKSKQKKIALIKILK